VTTAHQIIVSSPLLHRTILQHVFTEHWAFLLCSPAHTAEWVSQEWALPGSFSVFCCIADVLYSIQPGCLSGVPWHLFLSHAASLLLAEENSQGCLGSAQPCLFRIIRRRAGHWAQLPCSISGILPSLFCSVGVVLISISRKTLRLVSLNRTAESMAHRQSFGINRTEEGHSPVAHQPGICSTWTGSGGITLLPPGRMAFWKD
jgi:hypothetical protein